MQEFLIREFINLYTGRVLLSAAQAARRAREIEATGVPDVYRIVGRVGLKAGEVVGYDGDVPKALHHILLPTGRDLEAPLEGATAELPASGASVEITDAAPADAISTAEPAPTPAKRARGRPRKAS